MAMFPAFALSGDSCCGDWKETRYACLRTKQWKVACARQLDAALKVFNDFACGKAYCANDGPWKRHPRTHELTRQAKSHGAKCTYVVLDQPGKLGDFHRAARADCRPHEIHTLDGAFRPSTQPSNAIDCTFVDVAIRINHHYNLPRVESDVADAKIKRESFPPTLLVGALDHFRSCRGRSRRSIIRAVVGYNDQSIVRLQLRDNTSYCVGDASSLIVSRDQYRQ
jgi:hypothetical protein